MPYSTGLIVIAAAIVIVFATFVYLLVNARSLMRLLRPASGGAIALGQGRPGASNRAVLWALVLHVAGWAIAGLSWLYLQADVRAAAPDVTAPEQAGIVSGNGSDGK